MRLTNAIVLMCLCAATACTAAQAPEPYDGMVVATRNTTPSVMGAAPSPDAEPIASEVEVPWTIALLSDRRGPSPKRQAPSVPAPTPAVEHEAVAGRTPAAEGETDLEVVLNETEVPEAPAADDKPAPPPKVCSGLVHRRS